MTLVPKIKALQDDLQHTKATTDGIITQIF